jgi:hypothetical protein
VPVYRAAASPWRSGAQRVAATAYIDGKLLKVSNFKA